MIAFLIKLALGWLAFNAIILALAVGVALRRQADDDDADAAEDRAIALYRRRTGVTR